ncbi:transcriptional regulator [Vibrio splendidus]
MNTQQSFMRMLHEDHLTAVRLAYIDFRLRFTGTVNRSDLKEVFGLAEAAASKVLTTYSSKCPNNMFYDRTLRANAINRKDFVPLFSVDAVTALDMLANGFDKSKLINTHILPYSRIGQIPDLLKSETICKITRAMNNGYAIKCQYYSNNSNSLSERVLVPVALMYDGRFWNFRAYERKGGNRIDVFKNFSFARTITADEILDNNSRRLSHEELEFDHEWNNHVPLVLKLHDNLSKEERNKIRLDFAMQDDQDELIITQRESELWILFKQWFIDANDINTTENEHINRFYKFRLANKSTVDALKTNKGNVR